MRWLRERLGRCPPAPEFVSFHADRPVGRAGAHPHTNLGASSYMQMLDLHYRSARLSHPGAQCTLLTDAATRVTGVRGPLRRLDLPVDHGALMLSRSRAQLACVEQSAFARPLVLADSDILFCRSLQPVFAEDFDVALTWRADKEMPINGGLLLLHRHRPEAVRRFFRRFLDLYATRYGGGGQAGWYGDQLALRDLVGLGREQLARRDRLEQDGVRIRLLPCDVYNFSPDNQLAALQGGLPDKVVLHFKGQRKRLMAPYWAAFLQPGEPWWPGAARRRARAAADFAAALAAEAGPGPAAAAEDDDA